MVCKTNAQPQPDFSKHAMRGWYGGYANDAGGKRVYFWPKSKAKREVQARLFSWRGVSLGAHHYYARIVLEGNWLWNWKAARWFQPWKFDKTNSRQFSYDAETPQAAEDWLIATLKRKFSDRLKYLLVVPNDRVADILQHLGYAMSITGTNKSNTELARLARVRPVSRRRVVVWG